MRSFILFLAVFLLPLSVYCQIGNFRKYQISETGYYCYLPVAPGNFEKQESQDGLPIYSAEVESNNISFGVLLVLFNESFSGYSQQDLQELLVSYMDHLKDSYETIGSTGYGFGHTLQSSPDVQGIIDYWQSKEGKEMKVKGWINSKALVFMFVKGKELPNQNVQDFFLNGIIFKK